MEHKEVDYKIYAGIKGEAMTPPGTIWVSKEGRIAHTKHQQDTEYIRKDIVIDKLRVLINKLKGTTWED